MKKICFVLFVLLCAVMVWTVPAGAEEPSPPPEAAPLPGGEAEGEIPEEMPEVDEGVEWDMEEVKTYINTTVIPAAVMVVTALAALYVALVPVFNKVKAVIAKFSAASEEITATAGESELTKKNTKAALDKLSAEYKELLAQNKELKAQYEALEGSVKEALSQMADTVTGEMGAVKGLAEDIEKMLIVGFCNNKELIAQGWAKKIAEIGAAASLEVEHE